MDKELEIYCLLQEYEVIQSEKDYLKSKEEHLKALIKDLLGSNNYHRGHYVVSNDIATDSINIKIE